MMRNVIIGKDKITIDSGYFFARGVFETILVKEKPLFLEEHIKRLNNGINILKIGEAIEVEYISNIINDFNIKNCVLKIIVTEKNILLETRELLYKSGDYLRGFSLKVAKTIKNSTSKLTYIKSMNYLENILEREEALEKGYNEVIFLNEKGYVSEGSFSNIFAVKNNVIFTPKISSGLLPGVVRNHLIKNYDVIEKEVSLDDIINADEIFITNSLLGIMGVSKFENRILTENKITIKIRKEYESQIGN